GDWNEIEVAVKGGVITNTVNGKPLTAKDVLELTVRDGKPTATLNGQAIEVSSVQGSVGAEAVCKCNRAVIRKPMRVPATGAVGGGDGVGVRDGQVGVPRRPHQGTVVGTSTAGTAVRVSRFPTESRPTSRAAPSQVNTRIHFCVNKLWQITSRPISTAHRMLW